MSEHPTNPHPQPQQPHSAQPGQWQPAYPPAPPVKQQNWFMRHKIISGILGLVLIGGVSSALGGGGDEPTTAAPTTASSPATTAAPAAAKPAAKPAEKKAPGIGAKVRDGKFEFVVTKIEDGGTQVGDSTFGEKAQGQFTLVHLSITNIGDKPQTMFTDNQTVIDGQGRKFTPNSMAGIHLENNDVWIQEINPGNTVRGTLVFDMPKGSKPASIQLHDSMFSGGVTVSLN